MPYVFIVVATLALGLLVYVLVGCRSGSEESAPGSSVLNAHEVTSADRVLSRAELIQRLERLAVSSGPTDLSTGAMCYVLGDPPPRREYVCPKCGERSLYPLPREYNPEIDGQRPIEKVVGEIAESLWLDVEEYRRLAAQLSSLSVSLDESQFCKKCNPDVETPALVLVVHPPDAAEPHRTVGVTREDLRLLCEFASGSDRHDAGPLGERPLKEYVPRIQELLGVQLTPAEKQ
jgi:hypothetical protein